MRRPAKRLFFVITFVIATTLSYAQSESGQKAFAILNLYNSAQMTGRGLNFVPRFIADAPTSIANPSTLDSSVNNMASLTYTDIFAGSYQASLAYTHSFAKVGNFGFAIQYINYGEFLLTEENGDITGTFSANDLMFNIAWGRKIEKNIYLGVNFKPMFSKYESYSSSSIAFDVAATWVSPSQSWQVSAIVKNVGRQIKSFANQRDTLPLDLQLGFSKKFKHAPLVVYVVADNLTKWNIREEDKLSSRFETDMYGNVKDESSFGAFMDKAFRHLRFAVDILPSKYYYISIGYSWRQHKEMAVEDTFSLTGLSYGFGINYKNYALNYARNEYHNYGAPNYITLSYRF